MTKVNVADYLLEHQSAEDKALMLAIIAEIPKIPAGTYDGRDCGLRNHFGYQDVFYASADCVGFLEFKNHLETFEKDALILEKEFGVLISHIIDPEIPDWPVPAASISIEVACIIIPKMIAAGYKVIFAEPIPPDEKQGKLL